MKIRRATPDMAAAALLAVLLAAAPLGAQSLVHTHFGAGSGSGLAVVADVGDLDGDGAPDLALGAPDDTLGRGRVTLVSGATHATLFAATGSLSGERFGAAVAPAGDVNGDGHPDVLVGAPGTLLMSGYARVLSGTNGATLLTLTGPSLGSRFGSAVSGAGDVDGDGKADLLVGAPLYAPTLGFANGKATLFSGANGSTISSVTGSQGDHLGASVVWCVGDNEPIEILGCTMEDASGGAGKVQIRSGSGLSLITTVNGSTSGAAFGTALANLGDTDGDGRADIAVGANGSVTVLSGADWSTRFKVSGPTSGIGFGTSVAGVGDVNGDGAADLACGAPLDDANGTDAGAITVCSGDGGATLYSVVGAAAGDQLGTSAACAGDHDADSRTEFAVTAPGSDVAASNAGQASIVALTTWNTVENGLPGLDGVPRLTGDGGLVGQTAASLSLTSARPITGATLVVGLSLILDAQHAVLVPMPDVVVTGLLTSSGGALTYDFALGSGLPSGTVIYQQFLLQDSSAPGGIARSNTVAATVP